MKCYKFRKIESGNVRIKVGSLLDWDGVTPKIDEVIFTDDFHLIITFKNGIVKDVDAYTFMNMEELSWYFEELQYDIDLFQNPYTVTPSYIRWNDRADISSEGLWEWGKTLVRQASFKKIANPTVITLDNGVSLINNSDKKIHKYTPHYHIEYDGIEIGELAVNGPNKDVDKCKKPRYRRKLNQAREYIYANKPLLIEIYNAQDGRIKDELAAKLPKG